MIEDIFSSTRFDLQTPIVDCHEVKKRFKQGALDVEVLHDASFQVAPGETVAIIGSSGSGKSTLLHLLGGLDKPDHGKVKICGQDVNTLNAKQQGRFRNKYLGFVYQFHHLLPEFTALENVALPLMISGAYAEPALHRAESLMERVGMTTRMHHKPAELSGGERQRAAIARALITEPACVLADEPTGNLDRKTAERIFQTMLRLNKELDTSLVIVTHDHQLAERMDRVLLLQDGFLVPA